MLLNLSNVKKMFGEQTLFDGVSFQIEDYDKIGLIGANGAGKSTLFKILTGEMPYDEGDIFKNKNIKTGYLEQYACNDSAMTIVDEITTAFNDLIEIEQELEDIRYDIEHENGDLDKLIHRQQFLNDRFAERDGFFYKSKVKAVLTGLGFSEDDFTLTVDKLSGGQKTRLSLGKILLSDANLLLLDEPTNHLDIQSVEWLEDFLRSYKGAFVVISHDRYFLDRVTQKTFELENTRFFSFSGNYSFYMEQKEIDKKTLLRNYENTKKEISRLEAVVEQQRRWNREKNIKTAESKIKIIEKLEKDLIAPQEEQDLMFYQFHSCGGGGNDVLIVEELEKRFDDGPLFSNLSMHIVKGEKVFLLGPNGCGKTTLLKILMEEQSQTSGTYKIGANIYVGYYDQLHEHLSMDKTVIDEVWDEYPQMSQTEIRNALAAFLFRGEDVFKEISSLSGGERARVELVKLILKKVNFLILDEPTNHLDIASREALETALCNYDGTMLVVSHDRYFINKMASRILHLDRTNITSYDGNYDIYYEKIHETKQAIQTEKDVVKGLDYKEQKRILADQRKVKNRFANIEDEIGKLEQKSLEKQQELQSPQIATDYVKASEITEEMNNIEEKLLVLYSEWETLQQQIEEMDN